MVHPTLRRCLFWAHLATGVIAGLVILILAVTGILMSFETQVIGRAESKIVTSKAPVSGTPAGPEELVEAYKASGLPGRPTTLVISSDPEDPAIFQAGREGRQLFHPTTKESLGKGAEGTRRFFQIAVSLHRWLTWPAQRAEGQGQQGQGGPGREGMGMAQRGEGGQGQGPQAQAPGGARGESGQSRPPGAQGESPGEGRNQPLTWRNVGGQITMASTLVFGFLLVSGLVLWIPRKFSKKAFKAVMVPQTRLKGRARDWNWHNLAGFWAAPLLLLVIVTGTIMGYPWANRLMFKAVGEEPPVRQGPGGGEGGGGAREGAGQGEGRPPSEGGGERRRFRGEGGEQAQGEGGERRERGPRPEGAQIAGGDNAGAEGGERRRPRGEGDEQAQGEGGERRERGPRPEGAQAAGGGNAGADGGERRRPRGEGAEGGGMAMGGERRGRGGQQDTRPIVATGLNQALAAAKQDLPAWETITLDLPGDTTKPVTATVTDAGRGRPDRRVKLTIDRETMAVTARENSFEKLTTGGKMRQFVRWLHTGEAGGAFGQFLAALGCVSAVVLVYTGFALAWRRLAGMIKNKRAKKKESAA
ncbi:PepSY domain-containing protein [Luteolibacter ambystomatis]|uniref:PepSY domain-containing protein n=1 Tax=Luteolibacter ambystomatis TaxID=2824561 RepID=A0A975G6V7_9BACT|nr:PepSY-associated TM helix domain-containing protein [Luteolibacter ambystomatis]QUE49880.1 PepSY domain-containing protein [Luteolibacter ambystomatis]